MAFLLENVKRLTTHDNGNTFSVIIDHLQQLGYTVYHKVLNSLDFGVPQKRERIYIAGFMDNLEFHFPHPLGYFKSLENILEKDEDILTTAKRELKEETGAVEFHGALVAAPDI